MAPLEEEGQQVDPEGATQLADERDGARAQGQFFRAEDIQRAGAQRRQEQPEPQAADASPAAKHQEGGTRSHQPQGRRRQGEHQQADYQHGGRRQAVTGPAADKGRQPQHHSGRQ
ncbi:hypothetical protein D3C81_1852980 [compost metagenome]